MELLDLGKRDVDGEHVTSAFFALGGDSEPQTYLETQRAGSRSSRLTFGGRRILQRDTSRWADLGLGDVSRMQERGVTWAAVATLPQEKRSGGP